MAMPQEKAKIGPIGWMFKFLHNINAIQVFEAAYCRPCGKRFYGNVKIVFKDYANVVFGVSRKTAK
jgi:hypothetical protein